MKLKVFYWHNGIVKCKEVPDYRCLVMLVDTVGEHNVIRMETTRKWKVIR